MNNDDVLKSDITHDRIDHFSYPFCPGLEMKQLPLSPGGPIFKFCGRMGRHVDGGISPHGCNLQDDFRFLAGGSSRNENWREEKTSWLISGSPKR